MAIDFSCGECGRHLRAPEEAAGRKSRCPDCGHIATVPNPGPPPLPSALPSTAGVPESKPAPRGTTATSEPNWPVRIVGGMGGVAVILVITFMVSGHVSNKRKTEERGRLTKLVDDRISRATAKADTYDFDAAIAALDDAVKKVGDSFLSNDYIHDDSITKIELARNGIRPLQVDYRNKIRDGWVMFEGQFMPGTDKEQILSDRKEEKRRIAEAERRRQEELRRRQEEEAQRQAVAEADERTWAVTRDAWAQKPVADAVTLLIAYLQYFPEGAHANEARSQLPEGLEQLWSARVVKLMAEREKYKYLSDQTSELATKSMRLGLPDQAVELETQASEYLSQWLARMNALGDMGFRGPTDMTFPDSSPAGVILQLRRYRIESSFERWKESIVKHVTAALEKKIEQTAP